MIEPAGGYLVASGPVYKMAIVHAAQIVAVCEIGPDDPEAIGPVPPAGDEAEDGRGIQEDFHRLRARLDGVEGATRRVALDLRSKVHEVANNLSEIQRDLRVQTRELATLQNWSCFYAWPVRIMFIALPLGL